MLRRRTKCFRAAVAIALAFSALILTGCDPEGRKQCEWVIEPEPSLRGSTDEGYIPVCARNRKTMKEDCRLQASLEYAKKVFGRKFRYADLHWSKQGMPRTIAHIRFCDGGSPQVENHP